MLPNGTQKVNLHTEITALSPYLSTGRISTFFAIISPACTTTGTAVIYVSSAVVRPEIPFNQAKI